MTSGDLPTFINLEENRNRVIRAADTNDHANNTSVLPDRGDAVIRDLGTWKLQDNSRLGLPSGESRSAIVFLQQLVQRVECTRRVSWRIAALNRECPLGDLGHCLAFNAVHEHGTALF